MKKKVLVNLGMILCAASLFAGCGSNNSNAVSEESAIESSMESTVDSTAETAANATATEAASEVTEGVQLPDGIYTADFNTDSTMFHVNDALDGKGTLTVKDGKMTIHISLVSKKIVNLYLGLAEDAEKEGAELLEPTEDTVTYSDGTTETVYGFDVPVAVLAEDFDLAILGTKGTWYDHKVIVTDPVAADETEISTENAGSVSDMALEDGTYSIELDFEGGSGKAKILSPASITVENGSVTATVQWSSSNYDYMLVDGEKYLPISTEDGSVFEIPVTVFDEPIDVIGDTVAMSTPHEIEYTITFHSDTM
jgi:major membrane immunogen (membrane-anchored lipoprotein)